MTKQEREKRIDELIESIGNKVTLIVETTKEIIENDKEQREKEREQDKKLFKEILKRVEAWEHYHAQQKKRKGG